MSRLCVSISICVIAVTAWVYAAIAMQQRRLGRMSRTTTSAFNFHIHGPCLLRSREMENRPSIISFPRTLRPN
jgi:hypothetical protein